MMARWSIPFTLKAIAAFAMLWNSLDSCAFNPNDSINPPWVNASIFYDLDAAVTAQESGMPVLRLDLSRKRLRILPGKIGDLTELKELILDRNKLSELPASLSALKQLEHFSAKSNQIAEFPEVILEWINLTYLDLGDNFIDAIPLQIDQLSDLKTLSLWSNLIAQYPASLSDLKQLELLDLKQNDMTEDEQSTLKSWISPGVELLLSPPCRCEFDD